MEIVKIEERLEKDLRAMFESKQFEEAMTQIKEVEDDDNYKFKVVVTTEWKDRDGEILKADGIDFDAYMKNPVVLIDHSYKVESIVGKTLKIYQEDGKTIAEWVFAKGIEKAEIIRNLYNQGFIKTVSIGFISKNRDEKDRTIIDKSEMLEFSFVAVPANPEALSLDGKTYKKALEFGIVKEVQTQAIAASEINAWDLVTYRVIEKWNNEEGEEVSHIYPSESELPRMGKVIQKLSNNEEVLTWGSEALVATAENPILTIHDHVRSANWPKTMTNYVRMIQFDEAKIERIVTSDELEKGFSDFKNQDNIDMNIVLDSIEALRQDFSEMKSGVKTLVDDKTKEHNSEKIRELGKELQKSLSAFNKETKSQK